MADKVFYIIAGEASGDQIGAQLVNSLKEKEQDSVFFGFGGPEMKKSGVQLSRTLEQLSIIGFVEVLQKAGSVFKNFRVAKKDIVKHKPDTLILIDYPGFNLRLAKWAQKRGIKVYYYVAPQTWAWKESRNKKLKAYVDHLFVILPFEKDYFRSKNVAVSYVGHPLLDKLEDDKSAAQNTETFNPEFETVKKIIAVLPGSRAGELKRFIPIIEEIARSKENYNFLISQMVGLDDDLYGNLKQLSNAKLVKANASSILQKADCAVVKSGTSTLLTALHNVPQVVFYKVNPLSAWIMRRLAKVKYISLPNLILDRPFLKELVQEECTVQNISTELDAIIEPLRQNSIKASYEEMNIKLRKDKRSCDLVARFILDALKE